MQPLRDTQHDFGSKLCQPSIFPLLKEYVLWRRKLRKGIASPPPTFSPVSVNLDLTTACNFACPHCVDSGIINTGEQLDTENIKSSIHTLSGRGLRSVILIGGGEPTLHRDISEILLFVKSLGLQVGIVTNGTRLGPIHEVAHCLEEKDWLRLSIDAARQETFDASHRPRTETRLADILRRARDIKQANPAISLGYSFVIVWDGVCLNGSRLQPNVTEMAEAAQLALEHGFDYISFKPCLVRLPHSQKETLLHETDREAEERIREAINSNLEEVRGVAGSSLHISESVNLKALLHNEVVKLKSQPETCHMQYFRTVLAPSGIFHCPAFRGVGSALVGPSTGYAGEEGFLATVGSTAASVDSFDARLECSEVGCFYNHTNHWIEELIHSDDPLEDDHGGKDHNFFL